MNQVIVLAGGKGSRMKSDAPKVLTMLNRRPLLFHLLDSLRVIFPNPVIVVGYKGEEVISAVGNDCQYVWQKKQLGSGHAVKCAKRSLMNKGFKNIVVVPGDQPLASSRSISRALKVHEVNNATITVITAKVPHYNGDYESFFNCGRIVRLKNGKVEKIVELKDADDACRKIKEVNLGCYCFSADWLWSNIGLIGNKNNAKEYYITDLVEMASSQSRVVQSIGTFNSIEGFGVNTPTQLRVIKKILRDKKID